MCEYCKEGKNLFLAEKPYDNMGNDTSEIIIVNPEYGIAEVRSQDNYSIYERPTRSVRRLICNYCPNCGERLRKTDEIDMNENAHKVEPSITKEEILQNCKYSYIIPTYGDVLPYETFNNCVENLILTDYHGTGSLILFGKVIENTKINIQNRTIYFSDSFFVPFDVLHSIFGDDMEIIWFNK